MNQRSLHFYEFGPFRLNATERLLQRGNETVALTPKVFDTLLVLVENTGHVLEKNELMSQLWPDSFVEESSLTQNISLLRRALSDGNSESNYIETIPKRGYRFNATVREVDELSNATPVESNGSLVQTSQPLAFEYSSSARQPETHRSNKRYVVVVAACVALVALVALGFWFRQRRQTDSFVPHSIAVLPFKTIGESGGNDFNGLGMADALIIKLSRLDQLSVLPTSSVFGYAERDKDAVTIGRELGVEGVLDGTVQREGDRVRVTAQLIRVSDGKTVWSGKFDERYSSIFTLQDSVSEQLARSLRPQLAPDDKKALIAHSTDNTEAYEAYVTGLYFWNRRTRDNLPKAIEYLERAVELDPNYAEARAILADCYYLSMQDEYGNADAAEAMRLAEASVTRALELNDSLAEAHTVKAGIKMTQRKIDEAAAEFRRALELNPNYAVAHVRYAYFLYFNLNLEQAIVHMRRAQQLDPVSAVTNGALAGMLYNNHDFDGCITYSQRALELEEGAFGARLNLGEAYIQKRMFNEAHAAFDRLKDKDPRYVTWEKAYAYALEGRRADAYRMLAEVENYELKGIRNHFNYALIFAAMGEKDKAFAEMDQVRMGLAMKASVKYEPQFDPIRDDPRFKEFLKRHNIE